MQPPPSSSSASCFTAPSFVFGSFGRGGSRARAWVLLVAGFFRYEAAGKRVSSSASLCQTASSSFICGVGCWSGGGIAKPRSTSAGGPRGASPRAAASRSCDPPRRLGKHGDADSTSAVGPRGASPRLAASRSCDAPSPFKHPFDPYVTT